MKYFLIADFLSHIFAKNYQNRLQLQGFRGGMFFEMQCGYAACSNVCVDGAKKTKALSSDAAAAAATILSHYTGQHVLASFHWSI